jgi:hypothetical protein
VNPFEVLPLPHPPVPSSDSVRPSSIRTLRLILTAAALLWCRGGTWPTVRAIADEAGVAPSTVLREVGTARALRQLLVACEREAFARAVRAGRSAGVPARAAARRAARERTAQWRAVHPDLVWLPFLAALADDVADGRLTLLGSEVPR